MELAHILYCNTRYLINLQCNRKRCTDGRGRTYGRGRTDADGGEAGAIPTNGNKVEVSLTLAKVNDYTLDHGVMRGQRKIFGWGSGSLVRKRTEGERFRKHKRLFELSSYLCSD